MSDDLARPSRRAAHLANDNPLRALTEVISRVPGGINLGQGVCDLDTPAPLVEGAVESIRGADRQTYTHYSGLPDLKRAIREKLARDNGLEVDDEEVMVASGSSGAMYAAALALLDPGDEVVLFEPFYPYHYSTLKLLGLVPVSVPLGDDLALDIAALRAAIGRRTRAMILNTPANPSGKVFTRAELESIASLLAGTSVCVFTDEVYEYLCYDGREHISPATIAGLADRTFTIGSFSKTFSITGWRIGYLTGPRAAVELAGRVFDQIAVCAARPLQRGLRRRAAARRLLRAGGLPRRARRRDPVRGRHDAHRACRYQQRTRRHLLRTPRQCTLDPLSLRDRRRGARHRV